MITVTKRYIGTKGPWLFDMIYSDGMEGGKEREDNLAKDVEEKDDLILILSAANNSNPS